MHRCCELIWQEQEVKYYELKIKTYDLLLNLYKSHSGMTMMHWKLKTHHMYKHSMVEAHKNTFLQVIHLFLMGSEGHYKKASWHHGDRSLQHTDQTHLRLTQNMVKKKHQKILFEIQQV